MADSPSKIDAAAEKAFAEAAAKKAAIKKVAEPSGEKSEVSIAAVAEAVAAPAKPVATKRVKTPTAKKPAPLKKTAKAPASPKPAAKLPVPVSPVKTIKPTTTIEQLKDKIMEATTAKTTDFAAKFQETAAEMQTRAKAAYDKGAELTADMTAFHKGNFDALVESGKVLAATMQDLGRTAVEDAKAAAETVTADVKAMAAVKSPTELFQLQGEIARRNLDTLVARTSKNAEVMMKLANDMFAPLSSRASVAMERLNKAA
jgi:phasin family protein